jgi:3-phosphoshikimate 1-carboxyvinyltransferase
MATVRITPAPLQGTVQVPSSKSMGHRNIICAGLSGGVSTVDNITLSADITATNNCLQALGVEVLSLPSRFSGRQAFSYRTRLPLKITRPVWDCGESGSTLRFFIPVAATLGGVTFVGHGKLGSRPLDPYYRIFAEQGLAYTTGPAGHLPLTLQGKLQPGNFVLRGDVSSQFVSGLLFALPLLPGTSKIKVLPPVESASYIGLTLAALRRFGIRIEEQPDYTYLVPGRQQYRSPEGRILVEGDWSQAAFWLAAGTLSGAVTCRGLAATSLQGDKAIASILTQLGGRLNWDAAQQELTAVPAATHGGVIPAPDCPDLVPILSVVAAVSTGTTRIVQAERLRLKECDRLAAMATELHKLGARITEQPDGLVIEGRPEGLDGGVTVSAWNDHRVAMSLAIAGSRCRQPILIEGSESVRKSYPHFWQDLAAVGGKVEQV